jgi:peptide/nickel transport system permease protein
MLPPYASPEDRAEISHQLGLDRPLPQQYLTFLGNAVQGDFGKSIRSKKPVMDLYLDRLPNTLALALGATIFMIIGAFPLGILSALKRGTYMDWIARLLATLGIAMPMFWLGLVLIQLFAVHAGWLPAGGKGGFSTYILPSITLGFVFVAGISRLLRSSMLEVLDSEYIKMLRVKGLPEWKIIGQHALRNAVIAPLTFLGQYIAIIIGGAVVVEVVFGWPGIGRLAYEAIIFRDFPIIQAVILINGAILIGANLIVDILYAYIDPRIRYS